MLVESLRSFAKQSPMLSMVLASALVVLTLGFIIYQQLPTGLPDWPPAYFIDEETGVVTIQNADLIPPLPGKDGNLTVVKAIYLTSGTDDKKFLAYYEKYTEETREKVAKAKSSARGPLGILPGVREGMLVRSPSAGSPWVLASSPEGVKLMNSIFKPGSGAPMLYPSLPPAD